VGSSRGQTTSAEWIYKATGLPSLNLSVAGANIDTKKSLIEYATTHLALKKIIWFADYYEFTATQNELSFIDINHLEPLSLSQMLSPAVLKTVFDHNTTEASFKNLKSQSKSQAFNRGSGYDIPILECEKNDFTNDEKKNISPALQAEINQTYEKYKNIISGEVSKDKMQLFENLITELDQKNISVDIIIPGYHPQFTERLKKEFPDRYQRHVDWKNKLLALQNSNIHVIDFFENMSNDENSSLYWNDGDHFGCRESIKMLNQAFSTSLDKSATDRKNK
jgi:hypothetical protein